MKLRAILLASLALLAIQSPHRALADEKAAIGSWGVDLGGLSTTVRPGDDFYRYVNERWLKNATIPVGMAAYDDFVRLSLVNEERAKIIIDKVKATTHPAGSIEQQIADMHRALADQDRLNKLGLTPLSRDMAAIGAARTHADLIDLMVQPWFKGPIAAGVDGDSGDPLRYIAAVGQAGLTLPTRDYYLAEGEPYASLRNALIAYVAGTLRRAGVADPEAKANRIVALETEMAKEYWAIQQQRDAVSMYHPMSPSELAAYAPGMDWPHFLKARGFGEVTRINVAMDSAVKAQSRIFAATPVDLWQDYLTFHLLDLHAPYLSDEWQEAHFDFHSRKLQGIVERRPLAERATSTANATMADQIGQIYVRTWFPAANRDKVQEMVGFIRQSFADRMAKLPWMDGPTRNEAQAKLTKVVSSIGYPDRWHDYSSVEIRPDDLIGNLRRLMLWSRADELKTLNETRRTWDWPYAPQEVNAGYRTGKNDITFPAGILQAPFFDPAADPAVNFGSIGAVIGHEFGHGFDDQGSRSDGDGRLRDWWTAASRSEFEKRTAGLVTQFSAYEPVPGVKINGRQNLGENIGDLGGLSIAYEAYQRFVREKQGGKAPVIDGLTGDQRFFMAWAQIWRSKVTPDEERRRTLSDPHSAGQFRANGIVRNVDGWYAAFGVKPGDKLYLPPEERVRIW